MSHTKRERGMICGTSFVESYSFCGDTEFESRVSQDAVKNDRQQRSLSSSLEASFDKFNLLQPILSQCTITKEYHQIQA